MFDNVFSNLFGGFVPILQFVGTLVLVLLILAVVLLVSTVIWFFVSCKFNPLKPDISKLCDLKLKVKLFDLFRWILVDFLTRKERAGLFPDFGFTFYVGRQGGGKTISMIDYLKRMKMRYPNCVIVANFNCDYSDYYMKDWRDILNIRNGTDGVIFAIDEIHSEYSSASWKDVPENLLSEISQQRKQRVKIIASAQYYGRIAKPLREQAFSVVTCKTSFLGRLTSCEVYDADLYARSLDSNASTAKLKPFHKYSFIQSNTLRSCYDTYEKINIMQKIKFIPRNERGI